MMKKISTILLFLFAFIQVNGQNKWFSTYIDSIALVSDAKNIITDMSEKIRKVNPAINLSQNRAIKNTTPYLIYIDLEIATVNLPLWEEVIVPQKEFFKEVAQGDEEAKEVFGLFFNGFYLAHELGHSFSHLVGKNFDNAYDSEYDANVIGILYWKEREIENLNKCYNYAKKMLEKLKNPVPENEDYKTYITKHYEELSSDPYKYGYIQFSQFVQIYEDKNLGSFEAYIKNYK